MSPISSDEMRRVSRQLERSAQILAETGPKAVQLAEDWSKSPLHAAGSDPGRGKGGHGDPTADAASASLWYHKPGACSMPDDAGDCPGHARYDSPGEQMAYLTAEVGRAYDAAVTAGERVLNIARIAVAENERAGIGWCACGRRCDGKGSDRLRNGQCPGCDQKERRDKAKVCKHENRVWHNGVIRCKNPECAIELTEAGVAVK